MVYQVIKADVSNPKGLWAYRISGRAFGPFKGESAAKAALTRHLKRGGLSAEYEKRFGSMIKT